LLGEVIVPNASAPATPRNDFTLSETDEEAATSNSPEIPPKRKPLANRSTNLVSGSRTLIFLLTLCITSALATTVQEDVGSNTTLQENGTLKH
jgi:hypothetical protein